MWYLLLSFGVVGLALGMAFAYAKIIQWIVKASKYAKFFIPFMFFYAAHWLSVVQ